MSQEAIGARVDSEITIKVDDLPPGAIEQIKGSLSFENEDRRKQAALNIFGWWDMPETIPMWREETTRGGDHLLKLPRGYGAQLVVGMTAMGFTIDWDDRRARASSAPGYFKPFLLRDYQHQAVMDMMMAEQGVYRCPAGGGKSVTILGLMAHAQQRTVVLTDKSFLLEQWRARASTFLGLSLNLKDKNERSVGKIGEGVWEERDLVVALRQTLWSRLWELKATNWASRIGLLVIDEVQHLSGENIQAIVREFPSAMIFGVSATPARTPMQGQIISVLVGPIVADTSRDVLYARGVLMKPTLRVVETELNTPFWPDHSADQRGHCQVPDCRKEGTQHSHRNSYSSTLKKLVEDKDRNALIGREIARERGHVHLVPSRQVKHLDLIAKAAARAGWDGPVYKLRGEENASGHAQAIARAIEAGGFWEYDEAASKAAGEVVYSQTAFDGGREALVLSTVADEGLDIPPIDRVHMVFPGRQEAATIQVIGRCERVADGKTDAVVVDYRDRFTTIFEEQHRERARVYRMQGIDHEPLLPQRMIGFVVEAEENWVRYSCPCGALWGAPHDVFDPVAGQSKECPECAQAFITIDETDPT